MSATALKRKKGQVITLPFEMKAVDDEGAGRTFEGYLSTSHLDLGDGYLKDVVRPGAFKRWLQFFKKANDPYVPLLDSHNRYTIMAALGHLLEAKEEPGDEIYELELEGGKKEKVPVSRLWSKWEVIEGKDGDGALDRLRGKAVRQMSMGYHSLREDYGRLASGQQFRNLWEVQVKEGSLVVFGMQPEATIDVSTIKNLLQVGRDLDPFEKRYLEGVQEHITKLLSTQKADPDDDPDDPPLDSPPPAPDRPDVVKLGKRIDRLLLGPLLSRISAVTLDSQPHLE